MSSCQRMSRISWWRQDVHTVPQGGPAGVLESTHRSTSGIRAANTPWTTLTDRLPGCPVQQWISTNAANELRSYLQTVLQTRARTLALADMQPARSCDATQPGQHREDYSVHSSQTTRDPPIIIIIIGLPPRLSCCCLNASPSNHVSGIQDENRGETPRERRLSTRKEELNVRWEVRNNTA